MDELGSLAGMTPTERRFYTILTNDRQFLTDQKTQIQELTNQKEKIINKIIDSIQDIEHECRMQIEQKENIISIVNNNYMEKINELHAKWQQQTH